ncbi:Ethanolamine-phosphate cytidylyltransferase [Hondaea fermentalgiana]|uniref:ethanolamine-phosphate cytidylyltransferase n=1 Tax=Hondaea fermentalgiana TaxID=2315210 RepID=A0A2R5GNG7_9STRA|nr:Ethanolamine-phosphate cytidylyltransferase [Hondaea fermentalgiana]|eukprot:GBG31288.1 Ethanolamine-phosphate cytidylyltransferase [Hondaea fermentalgiana]
MAGASESMRQAVQAGRGLVKDVVDARSVEPMYEAFKQSETMRNLKRGVDRLLKAGGYTEPYPTEEQLLATLSIMALTLMLYYIFFGKRHQHKRAILANKLAEAERKVAELERQMDDLDSEDELFCDDDRPIRVWMDGAFDMMHYGHMNAFRQGRSLGNYLVVGINSDESIKECKGTAPVMNDQERCGAVKGCKWVDEIVPGAPYVMTPEYLNYVIKKYKIDYVVHGDDPCIVDGKDVYEDAKRRGIYRSIPRTEGVSTTDIVGRMLYLSRDHHEKGQHERPDLVSRERKRSNSMSSVTSEGSLNPDGTVSSGFFRPSRFLTTSRMLRIFSAGARDPPPGARVVYIDGAWDMFHMGHVKTLQRARELGDYLIVGVHGDKVVNERRGKNFPIMNLNERLLSVLGCRYASDVLIDAPWHITREMIASLRIDVVARGTVSDHPYDVIETSSAYKVPKEMKILETIKSESDLSVEAIVKRILTNEEVFANKVDKKMKAEGEYYAKRYGFEADADADADE